MEKDTKVVNITDKELLAICNLSNLKMEFANLKNEELITENGVQKKILSNHTIYSLIKNELEGHKKREIIRKEKNFPQLFTDKMIYIFNENDLPIDLDEEKLAEKYKIEKEYSKENLGSFFRITDEEKFICYYNSKEELIFSAPFVMECFDSFEEGKDENNNFLNDWEILFAGDNYSIWEKTFEILEKKMVKIDKKTFPTREKIKNERNYKLLYDSLDKIINNPFIAEIAGEYIPSIDIPQIDLEISYSDLQEAIPAISKNIENKYTSTYYLNRSISLLDEGIRIVICKNNKLNKIVIAFQNNQKLQYIDNELNKGIFPKELFLLREIYYDIISEHGVDFDIIFTGVGVAGKLANLYGIFHKTMSKAFYLEAPTNLKNISFFKLENLEKLLGNLEYYSYTTDIIFEGKKLGAKTLFYQIFIFISSIVFKRKINYKIILSAIGDIFKEIFSLLKTSKNNSEIEVSRQIFIKILKENKILEENNVVSSKIKEKNYYTYFNSKLNEKIDNLQIEDFLLILALEYLCGFSVEKNDIFSFNSCNNKLPFLIFKNEDLSIELTIFFKYENNETSINKIRYLDSYLSRDSEEIVIGLLLLSVLTICYEFNENLKNVPYEFIHFNSEDINSQTFSLLNLELLFAPYLDTTGTLNLDKISDEYMASFCRSCFTSNEEINEKNRGKEIEDENPKNFIFGMATPSDRESLNESLIKIMENKGKNIAQPIHYKSTIKRLKEDSKIVEKLYTIEEDKYSKNKAELKLGIFNSDKKFAPEKIGFAYSNLDKIKIGLSTIPLYFLDTTNIDLINTTKVCAGAILECSCGTAEKKLKVNSQFNYIVGEELVATKDDNSPLLNVGDFGACRCKDNKPCKNFISLGSWNGVSPNNTINGKNILLNTCTISCGAGGTITIKNSNCKSNAN